MEHFIFFGTLLGYVRENNVIDGDDDVDIYVNSQHYYEIYKYFAKSDNEYGIKIGRPLTFIQITRNLEGMETYVDFYFYDVHLDYLSEKWNFFGDYNNTERTLHVPKNFVYPIQSGMMDNIIVNIPYSPYDICVFLYGLRFMEPMSKSKEEYGLRMENNAPVVTYKKQDIGSSWDEIYNTNKQIPDTPSSFSAFVLQNYLFSQFKLELIDEKEKSYKVIHRPNLLEIGCGNGRDTVIFTKTGIQVCAIDGTESIINTNKSKYPYINFMHLQVQDINTLPYSFENIYCRFFLHAISKTTASQMFRNFTQLLNTGGYIYIECRSINDILYGKGIPGENEHEFIFGHYRRFIVMSELISELTDLGFTILYSHEDIGFSPLNQAGISANPRLIRVVAQLGSPLFVDSQ